MAESECSGEKATTGVITHDYSFCSRFVQFCEPMLELDIDAALSIPAGAAVSVEWDDSLYVGNVVSSTHGSLWIKCKQVLKELRFWKFQSQGFGLEAPNRGHRVEDSEAASAVVSIRWNGFPDNSDVVPQRVQIPPALPAKTFAHAPSFLHFLR